MQVSESDVSDPEKGVLRQKSENNAFFYYHSHGEQ